MKFLEKIFSIKNSDDIYKIITIFGIQIKKRDRLLVLQKRLKPVLRYIQYTRHKINTDIIDIQINKFKKRNIIGINQEQERNPKLIVSLTTFPDRIGDVYYAIFSILNQTVKPDKVILWLGEEQFPDKENDVSQAVLDFKKHGLEIEFTKDIKSYKKLIPALKKYPEDIIVTADDDIYYPETWLEQLYSEYLEDKNCIYSHRNYKITLDKNNNILPIEKWQKFPKDASCSFSNYPTTGGGVLFPPNSLYKDATNEELFLKLSPYCDETWFWVQAVLNKTKIKIVKNPLSQITIINPLRMASFGEEKSLTVKNIEGNYKQKQIDSLIAHYPDVLKNIIQERKQNA